MSSSVVSSTEPNVTLATGSTVQVSLPPMLVSTLVNLCDDIQALRL